MRQGGGVRGRGSNREPGAIRASTASPSFEGNSVGDIMIIASSPRHPSQFARPHAAGSESENDLAAADRHLRT